MKKKNLDILKTRDFLNQYPIILFLQHNNLKVKDWADLRIKFKNNNTCNIFLFKNTIMQTALVNLFLENKTNDNIDIIFQGPSFALGCTEISELKKLWKTIQATQNIILLGGIYSNQFLNHLDLEKLLTLQQSQVYNTFFNNINSSHNLYNTLQTIPDIQVFQQVGLNLLHCLMYLQKN